MKLYIFRHNKFRSSWSMLAEPNIYRGGYMHAEILVLAPDLEAAYGLLMNEADWDVEEIRRLTPLVVELDQPRVVTALVHGG